MEMIVPAMPDIRKLFFQLKAAGAPLQMRLDDSAVLCYLKFVICFKERTWTP